MVFKVSSNPQNSVILWFYFSEKHSQNECVGFYLTIRKKCTFQSFKKKKPPINKHTNKKTFWVWRVTFFSAAGDACIPLAFTTVLACVLMHHLEDITSMSLGIPHLFDRWPAVAASFRAETEWLPTFGKSPPTSGGSLQLARFHCLTECAQVVETKCNVMRS